MSRVMVLGATSAIARALCFELAQRGDVLYLAGRDEDELKRIAADLEIRFQQPVFQGRIDAADLQSHAEFVERAAEEMCGLDGVVFAIGMLGDQPADSADPEMARKLADVNFTSALTLLGAAANLLESRGKGFILGISSVAGDRGRQSNYVYGAAKGGLTIFLQGLRNRLHPLGVKVFTIKLGFVDTAMTYGKKGLFLVATPEQAARAMIKVLKKPANAYYIPAFWRPLMWIIRLVPERLFKRLKL